MHRQIVIVVAVMTSIVAVDLLAAPPQPAPEIFSLIPNEGRVDQLIELKGSALAEAKHVYFSVGRVTREASFKVISDKELQVVAPPFFGSGVQAIVTVETAHGVTVGMPASARTVDKILAENRASHLENGESFYMVVKNGVLTSPSGIVFVDDGGIAEAPSHASLCFVKSGGSLLKLGEFSGLVFHEPQLQVQTRPPQERLHHSARFISAQQVAVSVGIDPFIYQLPDQPEGRAESAPKVASVSPARIEVGTLLTLNGRGFLETSEVLVTTSRGPIEADFRIVSDHQLEVDCPDSRFVIRNPLLTVINPKGATVVVSNAHLANNGAPGRVLQTTMEIVRAKSVVSNGSGGGNYFIEEGGIVAKTGGACNFFVKKGGRMSLNGGSGSQTIICENKADIENDGTRSTGNFILEVASISMSVISSPIEFIRP